MSTDLPSSTTTITSLMNNSTISPLLTTPHPVVFVAVEDTIADVALKAKASAGLSTTISVLMSLLVTASFFLNSTLFATILSSYKLRKSVLSLMFCTLALLNLLDVLLIMLMSLLCVANSGQWIFGDGLCRLNAFVQQFVLLATLLTLTLMAVERALSLIGRHLVTCKFFGLLSLLFTVIPACFAAPLFLPGIPVTVFAYRYLCAIDSGSPIIYSIAQLLVYGGCFFVLLLCFGAILKHKRVERSLPVKPQDYGAFIMESRALEEHMNLSRVVLCLTLEFLLVEGPYICLDFFIQIRNSYELLNRWGTTELEIPQDVDTLITLVKLFHPLLVPMLIFASCADIWTKFVNLICCRRNPGQLPNSWGGQPIDGNHDMNTPNVLTIYATAEGGLQLRLPHQVVPHPSMIAAATATANGNQQQQQQRREYANNQHNNNNYRANGLEAISEDEYNNNEEHADDDDEEESGGAENGAVASTSQQQQQQQHWQQRTRTEVIGASGGAGLGVNMGGGEPPAEEQQEAEPAAGRPKHAANVIIKGRKRKLRRRAGGGGVGGGQQQQQQPAAVRQAWKAH